MPTATASRDLDRYVVEVVDRAFDVLELLKNTGRALGLQEISQRLEMVKSSCFRLLCTLERRGYVERLDGAYQLGLTLRAFGRGAPHRPLTELALPHMRRLLEQFRRAVRQ